MSAPTRAWLRPARSAQGPRKRGTARRFLVRPAQLGLGLAAAAAAGAAALAFRAYLDPALLLPLLSGAFLCR